MLSRHKFKTNFGITFITISEYENLWKSEVMKDNSFNEVDFELRSNFLQQ